jgi:hypothetical protein
MITLVVICVTMNTPINHLAQHSTINMALKWHHKNTSNKIIVFIEFWQSSDVFFDSLDCDCTHYYYSEII